MGSFIISKQTRRHWHQARFLVVAMVVSVLLHLALALNPSLHLGLLSLGSPPPEQEPMTYTDVAVVSETSSPIAEVQTPSPPAATSTTVAPPLPAASSETTQTSADPLAGNEQHIPEADALTNLDAPADAPSNNHEAPNTSAEASQAYQADRSTNRRAFPARLTLSYDLFKGDQAIKIGRANHRWFAEGGRYQLSTEAEATGILAMLNLGIFSQQSRGKLTTQGIAPEHYREMRGENRRHHYIAEFDYANNTLQLGLADAPNITELAPGTQDQLSFIYQLAMQAPLPASVTLPITTGRRYAPYTIAILGEKSLRTPLGELNTLHLSRLKRQAKDEAIDIWLAVDYHYLPVKIVMTDRKGDTYSQLIRTINQQE